MKVFLQSHSLMTILKLVMLDLIKMVTHVQIQISYLQTLQVQEDLLMEDKSTCHMILHTSQLTSVLEIQNTDPNAQSRGFLKDAWSPLISKCSEKSKNGNNISKFYNGIELLISIQPK